MNNGITGDNDLNLALDVTAGQMNYSAIANSSTCFIVRAPTALDVVCLHSVCVSNTCWYSTEGPEENACLVIIMASLICRRRRRFTITCLGAHHLPLALTSCSAPAVAGTPYMISYLNSK